MNSIQGRLTRNLLLVSYLLFGGGLIAVYFSTREELISGFDAALQSKAVALSTLARVSQGGALRVDGGEKLARNFEDSRQNDFFEIWNSDAAVVYRSEALGAADLPRITGHFRRPRHLNFTMPNGRFGRAVEMSFIPFGAMGDSVPFQLVVAMDREELDETLTELLIVVVICGGLLGGATLLFIPPVLRRGLHPLKVLSEQATRIDARSLSTRFGTEGMPVELLPISERLNELLGRLEQSFERERRFSADLAHELRTPLAELRSLAECALKWPESRDPNADKDTLDIARQMEAIVTRMLALTRSERGQLSIHRTSIDLPDFVRRAWTPFSQRASERGLCVGMDLAPTTAEVDEVLFRSILNNLFDNAVDYSPVGGELSMRVGEIQGEVVFTISNKIENLESEDVTRLFDPFWRKDAARSGEGNHVGLGLSLALAFASAMGWKLTASIVQPGRIEFLLSSPVVKPV